MSTAFLLGTNAAVLLGCVLTLWLISLRIRDVSIVDIFWAPAFAIVSIATAAFGAGYSPRAYLLASLTSLWGLRLGTYLFQRNHGKPEDYRYAAMRKAHGSRFPVVSLFTVFLLQGALVWLISLPIQLAGTSMTPARLGLLSAVGSVIFCIGFAFEAIGDAQLNRFKADPMNKGKVMDRGLWRYTRHPNYFGNACLWWGLYLVALDADGTWFTIISPVIMTILLLKVSGVAMLEKTIVKRRPAYEDYIRRTSAFIPWPPKAA